jgi:hypothetical protein
MSNPSLVHRQTTAPDPAVLATMSAEVDDDENDADLDDEDDVAPTPYERWASHPGFGSPQWWSH